MTDQRNLGMKAIRTPTLLACIETLSQFGDDPDLEASSTAPARKA
jgi:hypothetical protein